MVLKATILDGISRELSEGSTRRGFLRLLVSVTAVTAVGVIGGSGLGETAAAKRRGRKRVKRNTQQSAFEQADLTDLNQVQPSDSEIAARTSIPPNCIYVCCDGTCDSWKMCLKCVKWPKPTTATTITAR
jgi:hypothetical protein